MFFFCSDPHGDFKEIVTFAKEQKLGQEDVVVVLGDACLNYYLDQRDARAKKDLSTACPCRWLIVRGNHDVRPETVEGYVPIPAFSGRVLVEPKYPNLLFAQNVGHYDFDGVHAVVLAGAAMAEPEKHAAEGLVVPDDPQLTEREIWWAEDMLEDISYKTDLMLTHTCPKSFILDEMKHPAYDQSTLDHTFEKWLDIVACQVDYKVWLFGHFHKDVDIPMRRAMCLKNRIVALNDLDLQIV